MGLLDKIGGMSVQLPKKLIRDTQRRIISESEDHARRQEEMQKEFAKMGIQWRVADAEAAGLHPLAAIGASGASYTPVQEPMGEESFGSIHSTTPLLNELKGLAGQFIGRAINATLPAQKRATAMADLQVEHQSLQNDLLRSQIVQMNKVGPGMPSAVDANVIAGQGDAPYQIRAAELTSSAPGRPAQEAGAVNSYSFMRTASGGLTPVPSKDAKERIEDDFLQQTAWAVRNQMLPALKGLPAPDPRQYPLPPGMDKWVWQPLRQEFVPMNSKSSEYREWKKYRSKFGLKTP